jgi:hypothetical protein
MTAPRHALQTLDAALRADPALQARLFACADEPEFCRAAQAAAAALGCPLDEAEVRAAIQDGRRAWIERHLP